MNEHDICGAAGPAHNAALSIEDVPSPCIGLCWLDAAHGRCAGCARTLDEIAAWSRLDAAARRAILVQLPARRQTDAHV